MLVGGIARRFAIETSPNAWVVIRAVGPFGVVLFVALEGLRGGADVAVIDGRDWGRGRHGGSCS